MMHITRLLTVGLLGIVLPLQPVLADADAEREMLARIVHELNALNTLIRKAESQAEPDARIHFRYDWLRQDLSRMQQGIQDHIDAPRAEPRTFPPLRGDYRR
ncbi:MAG: conjugal transfer protein [Gammaproteobacteria bacterium]|nr:conjugal transfer protein [Gammaproteobacteria bacterium]